MDDGNAAHFTFALYRYLTYISISTVITVFYFTEMNGNDFINDGNTTNRELSNIGYHVMYTYTNYVFDYFQFTSIRYFR